MDQQLEAKTLRVFVGLKVAPKIDQEGSSALIQIIDVVRFVRIGGG